MPYGLADRTQHHGRHEIGEKSAQPGHLSERGAVTAVRFDHPLQSGRAYCCGFPHSGQNFEFRGMGLPHSWQNLVSGAAGSAGAGFIAFIICCAMVSPAASPTPTPAAPPPSFAAAIGMDCATWNCVYRFMSPTMFMPIR